MKLSSYLLLCLMFILLLGSCKQQQWKQQNLLQQITLTEGDSSIICYLTNKSRKVSPEKTYFSFHHQQVVGQRGGYSGKLLHGTFEVFDNDNLLIQKGKFDRGLKEGKWITWQNGDIQKITIYHSGVKDGLTTIYENNEPIAILKYNNGRLSGPSTYYNVTDTSHLEVTYNKGTPADTTIIRIE